MLKPIGLLIISNIFMTFAWYGHLKNMAEQPLWIVVLMSWSIALLEYTFQVPANRLGSDFFSLPQLKIIQEVITLAVFCGICRDLQGNQTNVEFPLGHSMLDQRCVLRL